jgi:hypothetical protein
MQNTIMLILSCIQERDQASENDNEAEEERQANMRHDRQPALPVCLSR